jgi:hypothetical protein
MKNTPEIARVGSTSGSAVGRIASKGSGARLNAKQYADWLRKVRRHDKLEEALTQIRTRLFQHHGIDASGVEERCFEIACKALSEPNGD